MVQVAKDVHTHRAGDENINNILFVVEQYRHFPFGKTADRLAPKQ